MSFIKELRAQGVAVRQEGEVSQPFFSVKGRSLSVNRESVQIFVYPSERVAETEAGQVSPMGTSVGTNMVSWMATPHFYRRGNLIAVYVGGDTTVRRALEAVLGMQFAGG